tara:strand:+ start:251 stop:451 length:201 start_codon:yes stop_codon:yes gene_type:complete
MKAKKIQRLITRILLSLFSATIILYALIKSAKFFGANYEISDGDYFITWSLISILILLSINHFDKK